MDGGNEWLRLAKFENPRWDTDYIWRSEQVFLEIPEDSAQLRFAVNAAEPVILFQLDNVITTSVPNLPKVVFKDGFETARHWEFMTRPGETKGNSFNGYAFAIDRSEGSPSPSGLISGDGDHARNTLVKFISTSEINPDRRLFASVDYRAMSDHVDLGARQDGGGELRLLSTGGPSCSGTSNLLFYVSAEPGYGPAPSKCFSANVPDSGWGTFSFEVGYMPRHADVLKIVLQHMDISVYDLNQRVYIDNFYLGYGDPRSAKDEPPRPGYPS